MLWSSHHRQAAEIGGCKHILLDHSVIQISASDVAYLAVGPSSLPPPPPAPSSPKAGTASSNGAALRQLAPNVPKASASNEGKRIKANVQSSSSPTPQSRISVGKATPNDAARGKVLRSDRRWQKRREATLACEVEACGRPQGTPQGSYRVMRESGKEADVASCNRCYQHARNHKLKYPVKADGSRVQDRGYRAVLLK